MCVWLPSVLSFLSLSSLLGSRDQIVTSNLSELFKLSRLSRLCNNRYQMWKGLTRTRWFLLCPSAAQSICKKGLLKKNNQKLVSIRKQSKEILQYTDKREVSDWLRTVENYLGQYSLNEGEYNTLVLQLLPLETSQMLADMIGPETSTKDLYKRILLILGNPTKLDDRRRMFYEVKPGKKLHTLVDIIQELSRLGRTIFSLEEVNK